FSGFLKSAPDKIDVKNSKTFLKIMQFRPDIRNFNMSLQKSKSDITVNQEFSTRQEKADMLPKENTGNSTGEQY
ncbi:hypothetical protein QML37_31610, partial [Klebsiella pneumoniae]|uniref:hypothetical protein n=1 Tax=Klebsiella pneumoniae TaxID=573 RepID=UPI003A813015